MKNHSLLPSSENKKLIPHSVMNTTHPPSILSCWRTRSTAISSSLCRLTRPRERNELHYSGILFGFCKHTWWLFLLQTDSVVFKFRSIQEYRPYDLKFKICLLVLFTKPNCPNFFFSFLPNSHSHSYIKDFSLIHLYVSMEVIKLNQHCRNSCHRQKPSTDATN